MKVLKRLFTLILIASALAAQALPVQAFAEEITAGETVDFTEPRQADFGGGDSSESGEAVFGGETGSESGEAVSGGGDNSESGETGSEPGQDDSESGEAVSGGETGSGPGEAEGTNEVERVTGGDTAESLKSEGINLLAFSGAGSSQLNPAKTHDEIQTAIDNALSGDTVWIQAGEIQLDKALLINKNLTLKSTSTGTGGQLAVLKCEVSRRHIRSNIQSDVTITFNNVQLMGLRESTEDFSYDREGGGVSFVYYEELYAPNRPYYELTLKKAPETVDEPVITRCMIMGDSINSSEMNFLDENHIFYGKYYGYYDTGGGVFSQGGLTLKDMILTENYAANSGGAAGVAGLEISTNVPPEIEAEVVVTLSGINRNMNIIGGRYDYNSAGREGGAIYFSGTKYSGTDYALTITDASFSNNGSSGALYGSVGSGGVILCYGDARIGNSNFINNTAAGVGGAIIISLLLPEEIYKVDIENSVFSGNVVGDAVGVGSSGGGAVMVSGGESEHVFTIKDSQFLNNSVGTPTTPSYGHGAAINYQKFSDRNSIFNIENTLVDNNNTYGCFDNEVEFPGYFKYFGAGNGGGIYCLIDSDSSLINLKSGTKITNNTARGDFDYLESGNGGGIFVMATYIEDIVTLIEPIIPNFAETHLAALTVDADVEFENNTAVRRYDMKSEDSEFYNDRIKTTTFTYPETNGYNNLDIGYYNSDEEVSTYAVEYYAGEELLYTDESGVMGHTVKHIDDPEFSEIKENIPQGSRIIKWNTQQDGMGTDYGFGAAATVSATEKTLKLYAVIGESVYEIWNWEDLAYVDTLIANENSGNGDKLSDYAKIRLMQNLGVPGMNGVGDGTGLGNSSAEIQASHTGGRKYGWFGYEGYGGANPNSYYGIAVTGYGWNKTLGWTPIGGASAGYPFTGTFDGNGKVISGLWLNRPDEAHVGLFSIVYGAGAGINNLGVEISDKGINGGTQTGGLVGSLILGKINECYVSGNITGHISATVGGIAGEMDGGSINDCYTVGRIKGYRVGGIAGYLRKSESESPKIKRCYTGAAILASISSTGISGGAAVGVTNTEEHCYADSTMAETAGDISGLPDRSTYFMIQPENYDESWNINGDGGVWAMDGGVTYPYLKWQENTGRDNSYKFSKIYLIDGVMNREILPDFIFESGEVNLKVINKDGARVYNTLGVNSALSANGVTSLTLNAEPYRPFSIGVASASGIIAFMPVGSEKFYEIWNWADLAEINSIMAAGNPNGYGRFVLMQNLGFPTQEWSGNYGGGDGIPPELQEPGGRYEGLKKYGWYGYEGFGVGVSGFNVNMDESAARQLYQTYKATRSNAAFGWTAAGGWTPVGSEARPFTEVFWGNGNWINGLWLNGGFTSYKGLFGRVTSAEISFLNVSTAEGKSISGTGENYGILAGRSENSEIKDCIVLGTISGKNYTGGLIGTSFKDYLIMNCGADVSVTGICSTGGLIGYSEGGTVSACYSAGAVNGVTGGLGKYTGGLIGFCGSEAVNCYSIANVKSQTAYAGGFAGYTGDYSSISGSYAAGAVSGVSYTGGFIGSGSACLLFTTGVSEDGGWPVTIIIGNGTELAVSNNYYDKTTTMMSVDTGIIGGGDIAGITALTTSQMIRASNFASWDMGGEASVWAIDDNRTYPYLAWQLTNSSLGGDNVFKSIEYSVNGGATWVEMEPDQEISKSGTSTVTIRFNEPAAYKSHNVYGANKVFEGGVVEQLSPFTVAAGKKISIGAKSQSGIVAFKPPKVWEIWNWEDLSKVMEMQDGEGYRSFVLMQDLGVPGENNFGSGAGLENSTAKVRQAHVGEKQYGYYGYQQASAGWDSAKGWTPIGVENTDSLTGVFHSYFSGNNHSINGLWIDSPNESNRGLFGFVSGGNISNLIVRTATREQNAYGAGIHGKASVGGLIGHVYNSAQEYTVIDQCAVYGDILADGSISEKALAGGLIGAVSPNKGFSFYTVSVSNCFTAGTVRGGFGSPAAGGITASAGDAYIGYCYSVMAVSSPNSTNGVAYGGLLGSGTNANNSFYDSALAGPKPYSNITLNTHGAKTSSAMVTKSTYSGWNFSWIWEMVDGETYPYFKWQKSGDAAKDAYALGRVEYKINSGNYVRVDSMKDFAAAGAVSGDVVIFKITGRTADRPYYSAVSLGAAGTDKDSRYLVSESGGVFTNYAKEANQTYSIPGMSISGIIGYAVPFVNPYEIWNWEDLAFINTLIANANGSNVGNGDRLNDYSEFNLMQDLGVPGENNSGGGINLANSSAEIKAAHTESKKYGWYGYAGYTGAEETGYDGTFATGSGWDGAQGWAPIGGDDYPFIGIFNGGGHTISGLWIDSNDEDALNGLFGYVESSGIFDLTVKTAGAGISGGEYAGILASDVYGGSVINCRAYGAVAGGYCAGGLIGYCIDVTVTNCAAEADIICGGDESEESLGGGLIGGSESGVISASYSSGTVRAYGETALLGGLIGYGSSGNIISDCYSIANIIDESVYGGEAGGLAGCISGGSVTRSYAAGGVYGGAVNTGGLIGDDAGVTYTGNYYDSTTTMRAVDTGVSGGEDVAGITTLTTANMLKADSFDGWDAGGEASAWAIGEDVTYPYLKWQLDMGLSNDYGFIKIEYNTFENVDDGSLPWRYLHPDEPIGGGGVTLRVFNQNALKSYNVYDRYGVNLMLTGGGDGGVLLPQIGVTNGQLISIGVKSESGIVAFVGTGKEPYEIWNWEDLAYINTLIANENSGGEDDKLSGYSEINLMQDLGVPGQSNFGGGTGLEYAPPAVRAAHTGAKANGWYGYQGYGGTDETGYGGAPATGYGWGETSGWTPIGSNGSPFTGEFNGNGHTVSGLWIFGQNNYQGLFGKIDGASVIGVTVAVDETRGINSRENVGGLVGLAINGSLISGCSVTGGGIECRALSASSAGGLAGRVEDSEVTGSWASVSVKSAEDNYIAENNNDAGMGGLIGNAKNTNVSGCFATGDVEYGTGYGTVFGAGGGLIGYIMNGTVIENCYASGDVNMLVGSSGETYKDSIISGGGLAGRSASSYIAGSYATGAVRYSNIGAADLSVFLGGLSGSVLAGVITNSYSAGTVAFDTDETDSWRVSAGTAGYTEGWVTFDNVYFDRQTAIMLNGVGYADGVNIGEPVSKMTAEMTTAAFVSDGTNTLPDSVFVYRALESGNTFYPQLVLFAPTAGMLGDNKWSAEEAFSVDSVMSSGIAIVEIRTPSDSTNTKFDGFRILRGQWANESTSKVTYLIRVNETSAPEYIKDIIGNFTITGESSNGFEEATQRNTNLYTQLLACDSLLLTGANVGDEVLLDGVTYCEIFFNINNTLKSGIADFTLAYNANGEIIAAGTQRTLIPGDSNKDGELDTLDHALIYNYLKGHRPIPLKGGEGAYRFELADLNMDGIINTLDHAIVYNMFSGHIQSN